MITNAYRSHEASHPKHGSPIAAAMAIVLIVTATTFAVFVAVLDGPFSSIDSSEGLSLPKLHALRQEDPHTLTRKNVSILQDVHHTSRAIIMSCPVAPAQSHNGPWKPHTLARGAEAVIRQLIMLNVSIPFFFAYYQHESPASLPFCRSLANRYSYALTINCFLVPEKYPTGQYGYAKIFAIRHVPARHVLWFDCDAFPLRDPSPLFRDPQYRKTGAMYVRSLY